mgnify:CR=1 FL=1
MTGVPAVTYRSTQATYFALAVLAVLAVAAGVWTASAEEIDAGAVIAWIVLGLVAVMAAIFSRLTVMVGKGQVLAQFGPGRPSRRYRLSEVTSVEVVRNKWWYGWGVRWIPGGSMYNVWGLDAVELRLESGKVFRIGTDEPERLRAAIEAERARAS